MFETVPQFQLYNIVSTILFLNLGMFRFLTTYEINLNLGYTYERGSEKRVLKAFQCYYIIDICKMPKMTKINMLL